MLFTIETYSVFLYNDQRPDYFAQIILKSSSTNSDSARLMVMKKNVPLKENTISGSFARLYYPYDWYEKLIDLLRNEKPLKMYVRDSNADFATLLTGDEEIGEEES